MCLRPEAFVNFLEVSEDHGASQNADVMKAIDELSAVFAVTLPATKSEDEWKLVVKNPKKFMAKSVHKGVGQLHVRLWTRP